MFLVPLETAAEGGVPPLAVGAGALIVLLIALAVVRGIGQGRPHS